MINNRKNKSINMRKQIGATILVAGTCIGGGMIALPMVLAKVGLITSIFVMMLMWMVIYFSAIINLELHLQVGEGVTLGELGNKFSGKIAEIIGTSSFKILSYALVAVYIYGGTSILQPLLQIKSSFELTAAIYALIAMFILMLPVKLIDYVNRILFLGLIAVIIILIAGLVSEIKWNNLPLFSGGYNDINAWELLIPVVFTSFGFQGSLPSLVNFCEGDKKTLKKAFFWGSFIPAITYIVWTCSSLSVVYANNHPFYLEITSGKVEVGKLVEQLSQIAKWQSVQSLVWWISLLAIITSLVGVGLSLTDSIKSMLSPARFSIKVRNILAPIFTVVPAYFISVFIPNAFIKVLGFAGMILVVIAILLPIYLLSKTKVQICSELKHKELIGLTAIIGVVIVVCEIINLS